MKIIPERLKAIFSRKAAPGADNKNQLSPETRANLLGKTSLSSSVTSLRAAWQLIKPYYMTSDQKWKARLLLGVVVGMTLGQVYLDVKLSKWGNDFYSSLSDIAKDPTKENEKKTRDLLKEFALLASIFIAAAVYKQKLSQKLQLSWREYMTDEYTQKWMDQKSYYKIQHKGGATDNPDQRIADDIRMFTGSTVGLSLGLLRSSVSLPSFTYILWNLSGPAHISAMGMDMVVPGYLMFAAIGYATIGTYLGHKIGKPLTPLNYAQQRFEANYRYGLFNIRSNVENIALYGGESVEKDVLKKKFNDVVVNTDKLIEKNKQLTMFNVAYNQAAIIFPYAVALPRLIDKTMTLGDFMQCAGAFRQVQSDLSWFFDSYAELSEWKAVTNRLTDFNAAIQETKDKPKVLALPKAEMK